MTSMKKVKKKPFCVFVNWDFFQNIRRMLMNDCSSRVQVVQVNFYYYYIFTFFILIFKFLRKITEII